MKQLGNTLYITTQGAFVSRDGTNVVISVERVERLRLPIHTITSIICFGNVMVTPFVLGLCGESNVTVSFLTENGRFLARSRRPPLDNVNSLLSFFYTILAHDCTSACESVGLDPQMGFLHADRSGRPSLALDLMEEFRPWLVDRFVLSLINLGQVKGKDFVKRESGAVELQDDVKREVLKAWQERKKDELTHPFLGEKVKLGLLPYIQAQLLARWLRGDLDAYPPIFYR